MEVDYHGAGVYPEAPCAAFRKRRIMIRLAACRTARYADPGGSA
jgi:hypothetical protein